MKKALTLLAAVAMFTAPVFAITVTGDMEFNTSIDFNADDATVSDDLQGLASDQNNDFDLNVGVKTDYTTVKAEISAKVGGASNPTYTKSGYEGDYYLEEGVVTADTNNSIWIDDWEITQDITGALAIDGPVAVKARVGMYEYSPIEKVKGKGFVEFDEYDWKIKDNAFVYGVDLKIVDKYDIRLAGVPSTWFGDDTNTTSNSLEVAAGKDSADKYYDATMAASFGSTFGPAAVSFNFLTNPWNVSYGTGTDNSVNVAMQLDTLVDLDAIKVALQVMADKMSNVSGSFKTDKDFDYDLMVGVSYAKDALSVMGELSLMQVTASNDRDIDMLLGYSVLAADYAVNDKLSVGLSVERESTKNPLDITTIKQKYYYEAVMVTMASVSATYGVTEWLDACFTFAQDDVLSETLTTEDKEVAFADTANVCLELDGSIDSAAWSISYTHYLTDKSAALNNNLTVNLLYNW